MKIAIVAETFLPAINGVTRSVLEVASRLCERHEVVIIAPSHPHDPQPNGRARTRCARTGRAYDVVRLPGHRVPFYPALALSRCTAQLEATLRVADPDVIYAASPILLGRRALRLARAWGKPAVAIHQTDLCGFAAHYGLSVARPAIAKMLRGTYDAAPRVLVPSTAARDNMTAMGIHHTAVWPRGVDLNMFGPQWRTESLRLRWLAARGGSRRRLVVGYAGRLAAEKRLELLVGLDERVDCQLVMVGDGPKRGRLQRMLPGAIFTGMLHGEALGRAIASFDVFVHAGTSETFCQGIQEALASGVPVVAPDCGGPRDLVLHGRNGLRYTPGDRLALHDAVVRLAEDAVVRASLSAAARPSVATRSWEHVVDALERHFSELAAPTRLIHELPNDRRAA